jgi:hypothetical protein
MSAIVFVLIVALSRDTKKMGVISRRRTARVTLSMDGVASKQSLTRSVNSPGSSRELKYQLCGPFWLSLDVRQIAVEDERAFKYDIEAPGMNYLPSKTTYSHSNGCYFLSLRPCIL